MTAWVGWRIRAARVAGWLLLGAGLFGVDAVGAQTRILPLGDSITQGGQSHASWRHALHQQLTGAGYHIDFVGTQSQIFGGDPPNLTWYPNYLTTFDRDHEGHWGWRTDQIEAVIAAVAGATQPDIVLIHLGTNDIGQQGAAGVVNADANLRLVIGAIRAARPTVTLLLAEVVPIGPGTSYFANAAQVAPLNAAIRAIGVELDTPASRVIVVDQNTGYNTSVLMQGDGLHPNTAGEAFLAANWAQALAPFLLPGNPPPTVQLTSPAEGGAFVAPPALLLTAAASDPNGTVTEVRFRAGATLLGVDAAEPWEWNWIAPPVGNQTLTAEAVDNGGATRTSAPVGITILPPGSGTPIAIPNFSFETPPLSDGALAEGPGLVGGWSFQGTAGTYTGVFNPPAGSYPSAGGNASPTGADGANVAYLFQNGGAADSLSLTQTLAAVAEAGQDYTLRAAIGRFLPNQPYAFSTWGGFVMELLVGDTPVGSVTNSVTPPEGEFRDALLDVPAAAIPPGLIGQPLGLRFRLPTRQSPRSTHIDAVRLERRPAASAVGGRGDGGEGLVGFRAPNPFRRGDVIRVRAATPGVVRIELFDIVGRRLLNLERRSGAAGEWIEFAPRLDLPPGVYRLRASTESETHHRSLVVVR